jgi:predicted Na+-dependent transporter
LLPMAVGMVVRAWYEPIAVRLRPLMIQAAGIAFVVVMALLVFSDPALLQVPAGISQPWGFLTEFLTNAEKLPVIGPLVTFLEEFLPTTINIAVMAAIASVILLIGYYGGVAVRNIVRATGSAIPRALATSTAARNVSMALILANVHFGVADVTAVIVFYMISLIVAAHQAVRWGKEGVAQAIAAQGQPAVVGLEPGAAASVGHAV